MFRTFAVLALTATAAQAGDSVTVRFDDLNPANARDARILDSRVHAAAELVCASNGYDRHPVLMEYRLTQERCIAGVSQTLSAKVLAMSGQSRKLAGK